MDLTESISSIESCHCQPDFHIKVICTPEDKTWRNCTQKFRYTLWTIVNSGNKYTSRDNPTEEEYFKIKKEFKLSNCELAKLARMFRTNLPWLLFQET